MIPHRIDLHHHVFPPEIVAAASRKGLEWTGHTEIPKWSLPLTLEAMEKNGIAAAVMSAQPTLYWNDVKMAVDWARPSNEFVASVVQSDPARFGGLASLPLPDTDAALRELEYAMDTLKLDGVFLMTSVNGQYPGDAQFDALMSELNRRSAVVVLHPNTAPPGSDVPKLGLPNSLVEFTFDTTRAVMSLLFNGTLERYPSIKFVLPHAGGTVPFLAFRITLAERFSPRLAERVPKGAMHYLRKLYYDTAVSTSPYVMGALKQFVPPTQIVYASDFPFVPLPLIEKQTELLHNCTMFDRDAIDLIERGNALRLFPRFA